MNPIWRPHIFQMGWFNHQLDDDILVEKRSNFGRKEVHGDGKTVDGPVGHIFPGILWPMNHSMEYSGHFLLHLDRRED